MTMKQDFERLSVAETKARLSEVLRSVERGPTVVHNRGRDVAVLLGIEEYERLRASAERTPMARFLDDTDALRARFGGGADLEIERLALAPRDPFTPGKRR